jgi:DNA-binding response OmpR family regulator
LGRVLVIDDDDAMRSTVRRILERDGHQVSEAANGEKGLQVFRAEGADVVVTDLIMPDKEGIETILDLRAEAPGVRILAMSGGDGLDKGRLEDAQSLGADASLSKPFTVDQLRQAVRELLDR